MFHREKEPCMAEPISCAEHFLFAMFDGDRKSFSEDLLIGKLFRVNGGQTGNEYCRFRDTLFSRESTKPLDNTLRSVLSDACWPMASKTEECPSEPSLGLGTTRRAV